MAGGTNNVLVVSALRQDAEQLCALVRDCGFGEPMTAQTADAAREQARVLYQGIAVVNLPLPEEPGIKLACDLMRAGATGVLLLVKKERYEECIEKARDLGIMVLPKPLNRGLFEQGLHMLVSVGMRLRNAQRRAANLEVKMNELKLVDRAKWVLIEYLKMSETEAHRYIEKQAMDRRMTRGEVAEGILKTYEN